VHRGHGAAGHLQLVRGEGRGAQHKGGEGGASVAGQTRLIEAAGSTQQPLAIDTPGPAVDSRYCSHWHGTSMT
jgi:hypothetical protein